MVPQFLQVLFTKSASAQMRSASSAQPAKEDWDAQYGQYIPPDPIARNAQDVGYEAGPGTRRWMVEMWLETLPAEVRPLRLYEDYEQIAFTIALNWGEQRNLKKYMQQLIFSSENAHWCFPPDTFQELVRLDRYIEELRQDEFAVEPFFNTPGSGAI